MCLRVGTGKYLGEGERCRRSGRLQEKEEEFEGMGRIWERWKGFREEKGLGGWILGKRKVRG